MTTGEQFYVSMRRLLRTGAALALLNSVTGVAIAQQREDGNADGALAEIIVTANKRAESILDIPYSVSAVSGESLQLLGATEYRDYLTAVPGVALVERGQNNNNIIIRGIASAPDGDGGGGTVVTYFDELALGGGPGATELEPVDIERIEVLRGPQGTLYGAGSIGGTLRIIPRRPDLDDIAGEAQLSVFGQEGAKGPGFEADGAIGVPIITDALAVRVVGFYREGLAYTRNLELNRRVGDSSRAGGRVSLLARPVPELSLLLQYAAQRDDSNGARAQEYGLPRRTVKRLEEYADRDVDLYNANISYDFGSVQLTAVVGYIESESKGLRDGRLFAPIRQVRAVGSGSRLSSELRLASADDAKFKWLVGAYYQKIRGKGEQIGIFDGGTELVFGKARSITSQSAVFGQAGIPLSDRITFDIGLRWSDYKVSSVDITTAQPVRLEKSESVLTPRFNLRYEPDGRQLYYVQAAKGFRFGGPNSEPPVTCQALPGIDQYRGYSSDNLWTYEAGGKAAFADGRAQFTGAVYYSDWKNIPVFVNIFEPAQGCFFTPFQNAGSARSMGAEAEFQFSPVDGLILSLGGSYTNTELTSDKRGFTTGQRLPASPELLLNLGATYRQVISGKLEGYVGGNINYVGGYPNYLLEDGQALIDGNDLEGRFGISRDPGGGDYAVVNLRAGVASGRWDISVYAKNLLNSRAITTVNLTSFAGPPAESYLQPRVVGITGRVTF